jgi:glutamyl-tRNA(Gln) amidotransferase subunit E
VPRDAFHFLLKLNLVPLIERIVADFGAEPRFVASLLAHRFKYVQGHLRPASPFDFERIYQLFAFVHEHKLEREILDVMLPVVYEHPNMDYESVLISIRFSRHDRSSIVSLIPLLREQFARADPSRDADAELRWVMKGLRKMAMGNMPLSDLAQVVRQGGAQ